MADQLLTGNPSQRCLHYAAMAATLLAAALFASLQAAPAADAESGTGKSAAANETDEAKSRKVENSVVKVFSTLRYPDPYKPWTKQAPKDVTGSGVVIVGKRILSNAHLVQYASQVQVQANEAW